MSIYDSLMLVVLGGAILMGMWKGLAWQVASLVSLFLSYFVASNFWPMLAPLIAVDPPLNEFIAMFALFLGTALGVWIVFGFVRKTIEKMAIKSWDRQAGAAVGAVKGLLICIVITMFSVTLLGDETKRAIVNSSSGRVLTSIINRLAFAVPENMRETIGSYVKKYNDEFDKHYDPDAPISPIEDKIKGYVDSAFDQFSPPDNNHAPVNPTHPQGSLFYQPPVYEGTINRQHASSSNDTYYDAQTGQWSSGQSNSPFGNLQNRLESLRDQAVEAVADRVRDAFNEPKTGKQ